MWANLAIVDHLCGFGWVDSSMCISEPSKKNQQLPNRENQCGRGLMNMWRVPQNARAKHVLIGPQ